MPSLGASVHVIFGGTLSVFPNNAERFSGTVNVTVTNSAAAFKPTSKVLLNGSQSGVTTTYVNGSTLNAVISNSKTWVKQVYNLSVSNLELFPSVPFTVTEYANNYGEWAPENPAYRQLSGSTYQKLFDLSPYAHDFTSNVGANTLVTLNGLDWLSCPTSASYLQSANGWLANVGFGSSPNDNSQWFYLVASSQASAPDDGLAVFQNRDTTAPLDTWSIGFPTGLINLDTFCLIKNSSTRTGSTLLTWTANAPLIIDTYLGSPTTNASFNKNGAPLALNLGVNGNYEPNVSLLHPTTNSLKLLATQRNGNAARMFPAYTGHALLSYPAPSAAQATEIRRYLASLPTPAIVVP